MSAARYARKLLERVCGPCPQGWSVVSLAELFSERHERREPCPEFPLFSFTIEDGVTPKTERYERSFLVKEDGEDHFKTVHPGDFVLNPMNLRWGAVGMATTSAPVTVSGYYDVLIPRRKEGVVFLHNLLRSYPLLSIYDIVATGSLLEKRRVHCSQFLDLCIYLPPTSVLARIEKALSNWDETLKSLDALIEAKTRRKKALMRQLLTGRKRVKGFTSKWVSVRFEDLLKAQNRYVTFDDEHAYNLVSVRRRSGGVFFREALNGSDIKTKIMKRVHCGDFLISRMQVLHGALGMVQAECNGMYASDSYEVFVARDEAKLHMPFLDWMSRLRSFWHIAYICSHGVHIEKMTFNLEDFMKEAIAIPVDIEEQRAITTILDTCDEELRLLQRQRAAFDQQKRGTMQRLLTGKPIVNE